MTISAMEKKSVVLGLAMCLFLSSFHEVSCQVSGNIELETMEGQQYEFNVKTSEGKATSSVSQSVETESEAASNQSSSGSDDIRRLMQGFNRKAGSDDADQDELMDASEFGAKNQEQLEEFQRQMKDTASSKTVVEGEITNEMSKLETRTTTFQGESTDDASDINQIYYKNNGGKESEESQGFMIKESTKIGNEAASKESHHKYGSEQASMESGLQYESKKSSSGSRESRQQYGSMQVSMEGGLEYESKTSNSFSGERHQQYGSKQASKEGRLEYESKTSRSGSAESRQQYDSKQASIEGRIEYESKISSSGSGVMGSLTIGQSGAWRCINQDKNGVKGDDSIVIPKYELSDIIKEESIKGSSSKTSSLITSLTEIVDNHKKGRWTDVQIGKISTTETSEKVKKLKATLKKYVGIKVRDLVARSDYEDILTMAARYEELTRATVTYISRLATYGTVIREGFKASQRVKTVHQRVILHENVAIDKQKRVDAEFKLVKGLAQKGDNLAVQIFAMKKAVLKLEAEKKQVDMEFQKSVENLSSVLEESSQAYEKHRVVVREWKEVQASAEYSLETIEKADVVWVQFLNTLA